VDDSNPEPALLKLIVRERARWCVGGGPFGDDATDADGVAAPTPSALSSLLKLSSLPAPSSFPDVVTSSHSHALCTRNASRVQSPNRTCDGYVPQVTTPPSRRLLKLSCRDA
jgi:hypothetical protein